MAEGAKKYGQYNWRRGFPFSDVMKHLTRHINLYLRDVHTGQLVTAMSADMRGNTDESWTRAANYLLRNRLLAPNFGAPQAQ